MKILIIGSGGREHALSWALAKSFEGRDFYFAPGNGGTISIGHNIEGLNDYNRIVEFAKEKNIDLTVVGPEKPLVDGIVNKFQKAGLTIFGPTKEAAKLEGSKSYANELMRAAGVPTADFRIFDNFNSAKKFIEKKKKQFVVKADGLAGGKGAFVCKNTNEGIKALEVLMKERKFKESGDTVVIEECLKGQEVSILALVSGRQILPFIPSQDHKRAYDGDSGPNTGGMGAYAPVPFLDLSDIENIKQKIFVPVINELEKRGIEYKGVLYAGLMLTDDGPKVLEFNVRFGDPEIQAILPLLEDDFLELIFKTIEGELPEDLKWMDKSGVAVVLASRGYPTEYETDYEIVIRDTECILFHAGTKIENRVLYTSSGRVLSVVGMGKNLEVAKTKTYKCINKIQYSNMYYRTDIADKGIKYIKKGG